MAKTTKNIGLKNYPDNVILVEAALRRGESLSKLIKPITPSPQKVSLEEWKFADYAWQNVEYPNRVPMLRVYDNIMIDLDLTSVIEILMKRQKNYCNANGFAIL
jgi:hypothetical protein